VRLKKIASDKWVSQASILGSTVFVTVIFASRRDWLGFFAFCCFNHDAAQRAAVSREVAYAWKSPMDDSRYDRAQEIVAFLIQNCNVPVRRIVAPGAMGEADPVASNETASGRSKNRRVEVKVLVNRGLAGEN
jgi:hypothetical protein